MINPSSILSGAGALLSFLKIFLKTAFQFLIFRAGKRDERLDCAEETLEDVQKGNIAAGDDSHDSELQARYK